MNKKEKTVKDHLGNKYPSVVAMCKAYNIKRGTFRNRIKLGLSLEEALTKKLCDYSCKDHLGNEYSTIRAMCKAYGTTYDIYNSRIKLGWSVEDALTKGLREQLCKKQPHKNKPHKNQSCTDHLGNQFESIEDMCKFHKIDYKLYKKRISLGWTVERALTQKRNAPRTIFPKTDHTGKKFNSTEEMCDAWGIPAECFKRRFVEKWPLKKCLTQKVRLEKRTKKTEWEDHLGNKFKTKVDMCKFWNISYYTFDNRYRAGWTDIEKMLTEPLNYEMDKGPWIGPDGIEYPTKEEMCKANGMARVTYNARKKKGISEDKLWEKDRGWIKCTDHLGNEYETRKEMCKVYGINDCTFSGRIDSGWTLEEALTIPRHMYIGEYRVAEKLKKMHKKFYHDCTIKTIFEELDINIDWKDFLNELQANLGKAGYNWSVQKIQRLRPDFVVYTDEDNKIQGVIEFDGEQHQNFTEFFYKTIEQFYRRNNLDMAKQSLFEYLNIPMLRIRHDQIDLIDVMVEDFIEFPENYITRHNTYLTEDEYWSILKEEKKKLDLVFA